MTCPCGGDRWTETLPHPWDADTQQQLLCVWELCERWVIPAWMPLRIPSRNVAAKPAADSKAGSETPRDELN